MLLIAVDEAGYGPKLGPLVVAASVWRIPDALNRAECFEPLRKPVVVGNAKLVVDDSKKLFHTRNANSLASLQTVVEVCQHWCGLPQESFPRWLRRVASEDYHDLTETVWLQRITLSSTVESSDAARAIQIWKAAGADLIDLRCRIVTAKRFNSAIAAGQNKSDLLSRLSIGLVRSVLADFVNERKVDVFFDRHGGRRFYGGVLQHGFDDAVLSVEEETKQHSSYQLKWPDDLGSPGRTMRVHFTVKGDSFVPVALSSIHAKCLREVCMKSFNDYFCRHAVEGESLKPTAGYPVDADRFLGEAAGLIERLGIETTDLVRCR
ncbi:hypothetical protein [Novipirellula artificiosorum]|uniref:Ribonuclease HIII n=1 Tax=Novipirellula artificiosorum TaxID=2528016 RepID=A0A5C6D4K2_9BACT|nr:hypothetical protein [Novipirellula artificiosorum]TWU30995.1 hypothetical protein Poly41_64640 [Novipirellula artificiosorum]